MSKSFTLKDIAAQLGISVSTVSRVLNDRPGINGKTRQRVIEAIKKYNYVPNSSAKSLVTSKTKTVALIRKKRGENPFSEDYHERSIMGIEEELIKMGYHIITISVTEEDMLNANALLVVREKRCDGFILRGPSMKPRFILDLKSTGFPIVLFGNELAETEIDCTVCENRKGSYQITKHLINHGHKRILFLSGPPEWTSNRERSEGYKEALEEAGLEPKILYMPDTTFNTGKEHVCSALKIQPKFTAVVAVNDATAVGVMDEARKLGLKVPDDLAVVGFDDIDWASLSYPPLTTVHIYLKEMGRLAAYRLLELVKNPESPPTKISVATSLVIRNSCGC